MLDQQVHQEKLDLQETLDSLDLSVNPEQMEKVDRGVLLDHRVFKASLVLQVFPECWV